MLKTDQEYDLSQSNLTEYLDADELSRLLIYNKIISFAPGDEIIQQGSMAEGIYIIIEGDVILTAKLLAEGTTNLETLGPGSFLGEVSFIEQVPCATSIIANSEVKCILITGTYIELLTEFFPETKYKLYIAIVKQIVQRLKKMHDKIIHFIANTEMASRTLFSEIIQSLTKPTEINIEELSAEIAKLRKMPLFHSFNKEEINELFKHTQVLKAPNNCVLIRKDEKNASCYIILQGAVQSSVIYENKAAKLSVIGPATLFAGIACVDKNSQFTITFATCEAAILFKIGESDLAYFQKNNPALWYKLFNLICISLAALEKSVDKLDIRLNIEIYNR